MEPLTSPSGAIDTVTRSTLVDRTVATLLGAIREGKLVPGDKLPKEHDLARELGVSRTATREALQRLVSLNVVDARHGQGYFVRTPEVASAIRPEVLTLANSPEELRELLEARVGLEKDLASLAARRATPADLLAMRSALEGMAQSFAAGQPATEPDIAFHLAIATAARNKFLLRLTDVITTYLNTMRARLGTWESNAELELGMHRTVYDAIAAGDADGAAGAMQRHLTHALAQFDELRQRL
jgi:GntR family transcriptional repressor for pyruvate dehydrogenase complex